eukprot:COSAG01_NODE_538_length_15761_cov_8.160388_6_plen_523_part_00
MPSCGMPSLALALLLAAAGAEEVPAPQHCSLAVVGAGWGGAYFAYRMCVDTDTIDCSDVCVFEANDRLGGRAYSEPIEEEGVEEPLMMDVGPYRLRAAGAPTSTGAEEIALGVTENALGIKLVGYTNPDDTDFKVVDDGLGNNGGFNVPIYRMIEEVTQRGGRLLTGHRAAGAYRTAPGAAHPLTVRFETGDLTEVTADRVFFNTPWAAINQLDPGSVYFSDSNATSRECLEMIQGSSVSAKYYVQYDDAWWVTKLGLTEGTFNDADSDPRLAGRYHDGPLRCFYAGGGRREHKTALSRSEVLREVSRGHQRSLECSGLLLATYVFSNAGYWLNYQANVSDAQTRVAWAGAPDRTSEEEEESGAWHRHRQRQRRQLRGEANAAAAPPPRVGSRNPAELLRQYHERLLSFHAEALEAAGYSPDDIAPPTWGYQGNWNSVDALDAISATSPGSGSWPGAGSLPGGMTRPQVLRYLMKPIADLPVYMGNVDSGAYGAWAEGSLITVRCCRRRGRPDPCAVRARLI